MFNKDVCRTCLTNNIRMYDLKNTQLQDFFEKLTSIKVRTEDGRSRICYICYAQLQRCHRFLDMSQKSDKMFRLVLTKGVELIPDSLTNLRTCNNFIMTPVDHMSLPERTLETLVTIKIEPADIKEEVVELDNSEMFEAFKIEGSPVADDFMKMVCEQETFVDTKSSDALYSCEACNKTYKTQSAWKRHISTTHKRKIKCNKCVKEFPERDSLKLHMATHDQDLYACDYCEKTFTVMLKLNNHIRSHTKPFSCHLCDKSFSEQSSLRKHVASHSTKKPFICGTCNKGFTHKSFLVVHLRSHTGERPFTCGLCDKTFTQIAHAISHKRTHSELYLPELKKYPCSICEKRFPVRSHLNKHMKTHSKAYVCEVCSKSFAAQDTMKAHMRRHTGERPYTCLRCGKAFTTSGNMQKHMKTHENCPDGSEAEHLFHT